MPWSRADVERLRELIKANVSAASISATLGRTPAAVASKMSALGLSLRRSSVV
jgi:hypothetical protein